MRWRRRQDDPYWRHGPHAGLAWRIDDVPGGGTTIEVAVTAEDPDIPYPHLTGVVLSEPCAASLPDGWHLITSLRGSLEDGAEVEVLGDFLYAPIKNLKPGERFVVDLPVPRVSVDGLVLGSLTNRLWVETARDHVWLVDHGRTPRLDDWLTQMGTDPLVRRHRLVVTDGAPSLRHVEDVRLSELREREPDDE